MQNYKASANLPISHPGQLFKRRFLQRHNISVTDAAKKMHMNRSQLSRFLNGHDTVTVTLAQKLEIATGVSAEYWLTRQAQFSLQQAQQQSRKVEAEPLLPV